MKIKEFKSYYESGEFNKRVAYAFDWEYCDDEIKIDFSDDEDRMIIKLPTYDPEIGFTYVFGASAGVVIDEEKVKYMTPEEFTESFIEFFKRVFNF